ncbi:Spy/CpxP family protein refolding chaperone [Pseudochelatococcus lubricantis]|uniref:Spy/CpxP family protein refolding chaperone n=1 Tax=Pseudochelatococcus lubricantis TaxID=1538102 RepID=A0ABX0V3L1_9HYPH|nr:Spy/CpxP family protein refolding chaperone [Pseudochelatococcus lubricantis]NIJ59807.1 Spy/CpxP family protein refolding chaperone [Pseudochelatococcus lubricantis]
MEQDKQDAAATGADTRSKSRRRGWIAAGGLAVLAIGAATTVTAGGPGCFGRAGGHPGGPFGGGGIERALDTVDATAEQEKRIWAIVDATRAELRPLAREFRDTRGTVAELLGSGTIDRAAVETLRAERIKAIDEASKKLTAAVLDAAEVLTPEQRATLTKRFQESGFGERGFGDRGPRR